MTLRSFELFSGIAIGIALGMFALRIILEVGG